MVPQNSLVTKYIPLCSAEQRNSYRFGTTWGWVNDDRIFIFGWTILLPWHSLFVHVLAYVQYLSDFVIIRSNYSNLFPVHFFSYPDVSMIAQQVNRDASCLKKSQVEFTGWLIVFSLNVGNTGRLLNGGIYLFSLLCTVLCVNIYECLNFFNEILFDSTVNICYELLSNM